MQWRGENMSDESDNGSSSMWRKRENNGQLKAYCRDQLKAWRNAKCIGAGVCSWRPQLWLSQRRIRRRRGAQWRINQQSKKWLK
jgi:hypothetical protein